jgi:hypothetical protein
MTTKVYSIEKIKLSLLMFISISQVNIYSQDKKKDRNFGLEVNLGYNTLLSNSQDYFFGTEEKYLRDKFWITPNFKLYYCFSVKHFSERYVYKITPFIGRYVFGGRSRVFPNGYKDQYVFKSIELGFFNSLFFKKNFQFALGLKEQYIYNVNGNFYGIYGDVYNEDREWFSRDFTDSYKNFATSVGLKATYRIKFIDIGFEYWTGVTNLSLFKSPTIDIIVTGKSYIFTMGFVF